MKLYYSTGACSLADHIVLEWIGKPYTTQRVSREERASAEYKQKVNPAGAVPVLEQDGWLLTQNAAILNFLADSFPQAKLGGDGTPKGRAEVNRWLAFVNSDVHGAFKPIFSPLRYLPDETRSGDVVDAARVRVRDFLVRLDAQLDGRDWLTGTRSIADPYLFVMLRWAVAQEIDLADLRNLVRFMERMYDDADVQVAIGAEEGLAIA